MWEPENAWVLDVCCCIDGKLKVVEVNSFNCSGMYDCDRDAIVEKISRFCNVY